MPSHIAPEVETFDPLFELTTIRDKLRELIEFAAFLPLATTLTIVTAYNDLGTVCTDRALGLESWK